jgi:hypothetical protein
MRRVGGRQAARRQVAATGEGSSALTDSQAAVILVEGDEIEVCGSHFGTGLRKEKKKIGSCLGARRTGDAELFRTRTRTRTEAENATCRPRS